MTKKQDIKMADLAAVMAGLGQPAFRTKQVREWVFSRGVASFDDMTNLPAGLRTELSKRFVLRTVKAGNSVTSEDGTRRFTLRLGDGHAVESVLIPMGASWTACVSSQVGCRWRCSFCASGARGLVRDLTTGEILDEVLLMNAEAPGGLRNVVFMGIGEPLDNYDNVIAAVHTIMAPDGLGIGARRVTISTCGVVPGIGRLAQEGLQVKLAVSLNAPDDERRTKLMPVNRTWPLRELLDACARYIAATNKRVTFEYVLIGGVNDSPTDAHALGRLLHGMLCKVNLLCLNPHEIQPHQTVGRRAAHQFKLLIEREGIETTVRASKGADSAAACGQLRLRDKSGQAAHSSRSRTERS
ncbi:MAG: 23S rRNA (adenine(2503)-C(2))-methyltransferase RlmN [Verrucomicrobia bacterium]|nr:23S rRNA (adenine(2503)-C(2))-methyltransferase RlmN [Verrucomicrobiota bacterium]